MKRNFFLLIVIILCMACHKDDNYLLDLKMLSYVSLYDYHNIEISEEYTQIDNADIDNIMSWDFASSDSFIEITDRKTVNIEDVILLTLHLDEENENFEYYCEVGYDDNFVDSTAFVNCNIGDCITTQMLIDTDIYSNVYAKIKGIYRYPQSNDTDFILSYYGYETMDEVYTFIRKRAADEIVFNYMWEQILNQSEILDYPPNIKHEINSAIHDIEISAKKEHISVDDYMAMNNTTYDEYIQSVYSYYSEFMIAKSILEKENIIVSDKDINDFILEKSNKFDISQNDIYLYYDKNELYYKTVMQILKNSIVKLINIK